MSDLFHCYIQKLLSISPHQFSSFVPPLNFISGFSYCDGLISFALTNLNLNACHNFKTLISVPRFVHRILKWTLILVCNSVCVYKQIYTSRDSYLCEVDEGIQQLTSVFKDNKNVEWMLYWAKIEHLIDDLSNWLNLSRRIFAMGWSASFSLSTILFYK